MPARVPLPPELRGRPFHVAEGLGTGLGRKRLRGADLAKPHHGIRTNEAAPAVNASIAAYRPLLRPGDRFSHTSAAALWGLPLPEELFALHVTALAPANAPRGRGVVGHQTRTATSVIRYGLPASDPRTLFVELASVLPLDELVVAGDAIILDPYLLDPSDPRPFSTLDELALACNIGGARGVRRARTALALIRPGAESRPETLLRLLLRRAGFPEPEVNPDLFDEEGRFIGRADLVFRAARVIVEYDGDQHRVSSEQYEKDMIRLERFLAAGWQVVKVRKAGLFVTPEASIRRVRDAFARAAS